MKSILAGVTLAAVFDTISAESMYNPLKSEVSIYNTVNFPKQVTNNREKGISIVQFYKAGGKFDINQHPFLDANSKRDQG